MSEQEIEKNMNTKQIYNDVIDEEINLDNPEDVLPKEQKISN